MRFYKSAVNEDEDEEEKQSEDAINFQGRRLPELEELCIDCKVNGKELRFLILIIKQLAS
jgi:hypothetical protein